MTLGESIGTSTATVPIGGLGGLTGWLLERLRLTRRTQPRLALLERIALAPRQSLALIEAEGRRFLVATSAEGAPAFYALDEPTRPASPARPMRSPASIRSSPYPIQHPIQHSAPRPSMERSARVSW
jgi:flagellar biogenesis protein FliO